MSDELKGRIYGVRRKDSQTVSIAFAGSIYDAFDVHIDWQLFESLPEDDKDLQSIMKNGKVQAVSNRRTNECTRHITLKGFTKDIERVLLAIGFKLI